MVASRSAQGLRPTRDDGRVSLGRDTLFRARGTSYSERAEGLCTGEQWVFARASRGSLLGRAGGLCSSHSHGGMRAIRIEACEPLTSRHASLSHRGMRASRRLAFLRGGLFICQIANFIVHYLGLIFTIQIYIDTLIFARRAYGVIL